MVRKIEERSSHEEEPTNCALTHCRCNNAEENFDCHVTKTLCQIYSRQDLSCFESMAFQAVCVEFTVGQIQSQEKKLS